MVFRRIARIVKGGLCPSKEDAVVREDDGSFPFLREKNVPTTVLTDHDPSSEPDRDLDLNHWGDCLQEPSTNNSFSKREEKAHHWIKLVDQTEDNNELGQEVFHSEKKGLFSNMLVIKSQSKRKSPEALEEPRDAIFRTDVCTPEECMGSGPIIEFDLGRPEEEVVFQDCGVEVKVAPTDARLNREMEATPKLKLPFVEISTRRRRTMSTDCSEVSSLSGARFHTRDHSLEMSFDEDGLEPYMRMFSDDVIKSLQRGEQVTPVATSDLPKAVVFLMDPNKRIFELVQVPYVPEGTTAGQMLQYLPFVATDYRLARLNYTGLAYNGQHISVPMVPLGIISEAKAHGMPIFAVPESYEPDQIEAIGNNLLKTSKVARLLKDQLSQAEKSGKDSRSKKSSSA